jgi:hypothetical protein
MARLQLLIEGVAFQNSLLILILNMVKLKDKDDPDSFTTALPTSAKVSRASFVLLFFARLNGDFI